MEVKNKSLYKKNLKTGLGGKGETWNVNCHTADHYYLWSHKHPQYTSFSFKGQEEANTVNCVLSVLYQYSALQSSVLYQYSALQSQFIIQ
jgi:hypothetical protein